MIGNRSSINSQQQHPLLGNPVITSQDNLSGYIPRLHSSIPTITFSAREAFLVQQAQAQVPVFQSAKLRSHLENNEGRLTLPQSMFPLPSQAHFQSSCFPSPIPCSAPNSSVIFKKPLPPSFPMPASRSRQSPASSPSAISTDSLSPSSSLSVSKYQHKSSVDSLKAVKANPSLTLEKELPKDVVGNLLYEQKAEVVFETGRRTRSDVWLYFGRVKLLDCGLFCKEIVACAGCKVVYNYKNRSQGTSTLRHHKCWFVFQVLREREMMKEEEEKLQKDNEQPGQALLEKNSRLAIKAQTREIGPKKSSTIDLANHQPQESETMIQWNPNCSRETNHFN